VPDYTKPIKEMTLPAPVGVSGADLPSEVTTMFDIETDVLIVGSGPAGVASAALLSSYGVQNVMIEKYSWLANMPRAHITNQRTMEVLRELGVEDEVYQDAVPQELMGNNVFCTSLAGEEIGRLLTWGNHPNRRADYELASPSKMVDIPQTMLEPIIFGKAMREGCLARFKTEYLSHTQDADGVVATVRDRVAEQTYRIRAKYMIGADGGRSQIVQDLGLPLDGQEGLAGSMNIEFDADLSHLVAHRPSVLYWVFQPGSAGGIGAGVLRMIRPWHKWLGMWNYDVEGRSSRLFRRGNPPDPLPPDRRGGAAQGHARQLLDGQQHRRAALFQGARLLHGRRGAPASADQWPGLQHLDPGRLQPRVEAGAGAQGQGGPGLLDSYNDERQPVGKQIVTRANKSIEDTLPIFETLGITGAATDEELKRRLDKRKLSTVEAEAQRKALNKQIRNKSYEFNCHGVEMGQRYAQPGRGARWHARARIHPRPGALLSPDHLARRAPAACLGGTGGEKLSTLDLVGRGRFTLLTGRVGLELGRGRRAHQRGDGRRGPCAADRPGLRGDRHLRRLGDAVGSVGFGLRAGAARRLCGLALPHMLSSEPTAELTRVMKSILGTDVMAERTLQGPRGGGECAAHRCRTRNRQIGTGEARFDLYHFGPVRLFAEGAHDAGREGRALPQPRHHHPAARDGELPSRLVRLRMQGGAGRETGLGLHRALRGPHRGVRPEPPCPRSSTTPRAGCTWTAVAICEHLDRMGEGGAELVPARLRRDIDREVAIADGLPCAGADLRRPSRRRFPPRRCNATWPGRMITRS
jgi:2,4-dichlorophenol 6-monooxygenase